MDWIAPIALIILIAAGVWLTRKRGGSGGAAGGSSERPRQDRPTDLDRAP